jgi:hypothetical protein
MALVWNDRVLETTATTGTGALALAAAVTGYQRFADAMATNDTCYYFIQAVDGNGNPSGAWETGLGTYSAANELTRTTPQQSSNADAAVNFGAGTKYVALAPNATLFATLYRAGGTDVAVADGGTGGSDASTARTNLSTAARSQTAETIAGFIASPSDKSYKLVVKMPHAGTITEATTISVSGTCTATFKVNSTALGGTANSVSSAEQSQAHASTNTFVAGDDIVLTVSANSSCVDMSFSLKYTRTLE